MPFYEYQTVERGQSCDFCIEGFEVFQSILGDPMAKCPECGCLIKKKISLTAGFVVKGREANQFNDIKAARYWRDKNGNRHCVTESDGYSTSATVNRQIATEGEIKGKIKKDRKAEKIKRNNLTTARANNFNREQVKKANSWGSGYVADEADI